VIICYNNKVYAIFCKLYLVCIVMYTEASWCPAPTRFRPNLHSYTHVPYMTQWFPFPFEWHMNFQNTNNLLKTIKKRACTILAFLIFIVAIHGCFLLLGFLFLAFALLATSSVPLRQKVTHYDVISCICRPMKP